jgi:hypothetical protein
LITERFCSVLIGWLMSGSQKKAPGAGWLPGFLAL